MKKNQPKHPRIPDSRKGERGFTLLELLIVTGILLVIVAIAVPSYLAAQRSSNANAAASSVEGYNKAVQSYTNEWQVIPIAGANSMGGAQLATPAPACTDGGELTDLDATALEGTGLTRSGYLFTYNAKGTASGLGACAGGTSYDIIGTPITPGRTGVVSWCIDGTGEYQLSTPTAPAGPAGGVSCATDGFTERVGS